MTDAMKLAVEALTLAANRLDVCALEPDYGTPKSYLWQEWAKQARAALTALQEAMATPPEEAK